METALNHRSLHAAHDLRPRVRVAALTRPTRELPVGHIPLNPVLGFEAIHRDQGSRKGRKIVLHESPGGRAASAGHSMNTHVGWTEKARALVTPGRSIDHHSSRIVTRRVSAGRRYV